MALNFQTQEPARRSPLVLIACLVVSLVLMTIYARESSEGPLHSVQAAVETAGAPLGFIGATGDALVNDASDAVANASADPDTLTALQEQNEELRAMVAQAEEYRLEAERLQGLLAMKDAYHVEGVSGRVIGRSYDAWNQTITIDVGSSSGVSSGMTVMGAAGVIGQTVEVAPGSSTVRLLSDPRSGAAAIIQSNRAEGIVRGSLDGLIYLENISADVAVSVGDVVLTSGLGGSYVRGLLIGEVVRVDGNPGDATRRIVVAQNTSAKSLEDVTVVFDADTQATQGGGDS